MNLRRGSPEEVGMSSARVRRTIEAMREWTRRPGQYASVLIAARKGVIVAQEAIGRLTPEPDSPQVALDTLFPVFSIAKPFTATAVMILVEEGRLGLNLPVSFYLPELTGEGKDAITILHLLTHTSGMRDTEIDEHAKSVEGTVPTPPPEPTQNPEIAKYLAVRWAAPLWKPPGQEMVYIGYGYNLLGEVIRRVTGRSLADFARDRILGPLGMDDTSFGVRNDRLERTVVRPGSLDWLRSDLASAPWGVNGLVSTAGDLAVMGQLFLNQGTYHGVRVLSPATVAAMTRNQVPGLGSRFGPEVFAEACYGLGWQVFDGYRGVRWALPLGSDHCFCHVGWGGSMLWVDPVCEFVGVYLASQDAPAPGLSGSHYHGAKLFADSITAAIEEL